MLTSAQANAIVVLKDKEAEYYSQATTYTKDQTYYYCVMPGNYPATMRTVMQKRGNWVEVNNSQQSSLYRSLKKKH